MAARDKYESKVKCDDCGNEGVARISENDGWSFMSARDRHVDSVPDGFTVIDHGRHHGTKTVIQCACGGTVDEDA